MALRILEWLHLRLDLAPRVTSLGETESAWQLLALIAPSSLDQAEVGLKRKRQGITKYKEGWEDGYIGSVGLS